MRFFKRAAASPPQPPQMPPASISIEDVVEKAAQCKDEKRANYAVRLAAAGKLAEAMALLSKH